MEAIRNHTGFIYPLNRDNVDTDQIIPKQFLKRIERTGFGKFLFYNWRFDEKGNKRKDFSLNDPKYSRATILLTGHNFGCGSSREHAPWALLDYGFKVIIAPSFADIFYNNSLKNGILLIEMDERQIRSWMEKAERSQYHLQIDLEKQQIRDEENNIVRFNFPEEHKEKLLNGWDEIDLTLKLNDKIAAFEKAGGIIA
ncbi:3-isopropylmalate dehydratase small subunit [Pallidibacillus thermolactis]|jgi:3-isopropylmalate/(R)-2-methylmalate dehydratase small subunit|uniref:3-isopropylmalate dehydratase small subunit n=1 Tax=Pallidibacillus thermolactis TaxID=251051 RepID=UPI00156B5FFE|nr:3-isopropylmalate dehydratase small subunit [Pallidibacillus thermolactis]MED1672807.1 3-isopropylmalate dehydratase small subunit [Pallidibacillus thermolactis subsp. kokeshiiformis]